MHIVELEVTTGSEAQLVADYRARFRPAVGQQPGFRSVALLRPKVGQRWLLHIEFEHDAQRQAWVATPLHQEVWPRLYRSCDTARGADFEDVAP
ncbi:MAG TPA: antibiotic biosynthesis monooxygenase [Acidimicrobiales bacterium]|nr:antibiotic biosynthesis monooxygenase [Acidimicrobiales bacterium]